MLRLPWVLSARIVLFLRRYMPTNILIACIRTRRGLKWGVPAMLLAAPFLLAAAVFAGLIANGGPGWLNLFVLLGLWNALKFLVVGPVSLLMLVRTRLREHVEIEAGRSYSRIPRCRGARASGLRSQR